MNKRQFLITEAENGWTITAIAASSKPDTPPTTHIAATPGDVIAVLARLLGVGEREGA